MVWGMYVSMGQKHDYRPALRQVNAPVLVVHGSNDLQTEATSRIYVDNFPNAKIQVVQGAGHFPFIEKPQEFAKIIGGFLK